MEKASDEAWALLIVYHSVEVGAPKYQAHGDLALIQPVIVRHCDYTLNVSDESTTRERHRDMARLTTRDPTALP
ncbi:hypothetical protein E2P81_ATG11010 [Venturia nashicola]|uniref:Uncharacterized protein n=1 Tax=Venturia nashicola TaxID=86259 RepID=A0A4Z1NU47_9PEZI|nr:hypothetical protein E6O75_ATG10686 [Venturia nashicola]TLD27722.1 hypothetical protein E2P81_ATG11010 [Venturia nashicola]